MLLDLELVLQLVMLLMLDKLNLMLNRQTSTAAFTPTGSATESTAYASVDLDLCNQEGCFGEELTALLQYYFSREQPLGYSAQNQVEVLYT
jgi:hypothetical protein|uniref:Uncharacterized protein n=1 Tax=Picea glauca TaxID=3330 RepID=A0A101LWM7_PICGL|nr:hypothetical protein ABT39_MTgene1377 [Picea glauca]QHR89469.1 hypothetical protein Q903MT_gene3490 [Picea sitchensis]